MPSYIVTDPATGRKVKLTGDTPPTDADLDEIFAGLAPAQMDKLGLLENVIAPQKGALETIASVGSSAILEPVAGLAGLAQSVSNKITGNNDTSAVDRINSVRDMAYSPSEGTKDMLTDAVSTIGGAIPDTVKNTVSGVGAAVDYLDDKLLENTNPMVAAGVQTAIKGAPEVLGGFALSKALKPVVGNMKAGGVKAHLENVLKTAQPDEAITKIDDLAKAGASSDQLKVAVRAFDGTTDHPLAPKIARLVNDGAKGDEITDVIASAKMAANESKFAKYVLDGQGKIQTSKPAQAAIRQGYDEGLVSAVLHSTKGDKKTMAKVLDGYITGADNPRYMAEFRPADAIGDNLVKGVKLVKKSQREAGQQLEKLVGELRRQPVDIDSSLQQLTDDLAAMDIKIIGGKADFSNSIIKNQKSSQKLIKDITSDAYKNGGVIGAYNAHKLKKLTDSTIDFGKKSKDGITNEVQHVLKNFRRNINSNLGDTFPQYKAVNKKYSESISALEDFQKASGTTLDLMSPNADKALGTKARGLLSNTVSREKLLTSISDLQRVANKYGGRFDDDIITQIMFTDALEPMFGVTAKTSLLGEVSKAAEAARRTGATEAAFDFAANKSKALIGLTEKNKIKAMRNLLRSAE